MAFKMRRTISERGGCSHAVTTSYGLLTLLLCCYCLLTQAWHVNGQTTTTTTLNNTTNSTTYATKDEVILLGYYLSVLQVVVIINSTIIGFLLLVVGALTSIKCFEDYDPDSGVRVEDPLWLKLFSICNAVVGLVLCQCFNCAKPKSRKSIQLFDTDQWRKWHMKDLELQKGIIDENEYNIREKEEELKDH